jgi:hypothetical protein
MSNTKTKAKTKSIKKGRRGISFRINEIENLIETVAEVIPLSAPEWEEIARIHASKFPTHDRTADCLKRKFNDICRMRRPTGDPNIPPYVLRAKQVREKMIEVCDGCNGEPEDDADSVGSEDDGRDDTGSTSEDANEHNGDSDEEKDADVIDDVEDGHQGEVDNVEKNANESRVQEVSVANKGKDSSRRSEAKTSSDSNNRLKFSSRAFSTPVSRPRMTGDGKNQQQSIGSEQIMTMMMMQQQEDRQMRHEEMQQQQLLHKEEREMRREEMRLQVQLQQQQIQQQQNFMNILMMNMFRPNVGMGHDFYDVQSPPAMFPSQQFQGPSSNNEEQGSAYGVTQQPNNDSDAGFSSDHNN